MIANRFYPLGVNYKPYDAEVESLLSKNDAYIVTDTIPQAQDIIRCKFRVTKSGASISGPFISIYGQWDDNPNYWLFLKPNWKLQIWAFSPVYDTFILPPMSTTFDVEVNLKEKTMTANGEVYGIPNVGVPHPAQPPITLFPISSGKRDCIIFSFSVVRGEKPVCDLIPVRVGNVGYMFDRVSGKLFGNQGTGQFILGADK